MSAPVSDRDGKGGITFRRRGAGKNALPVYPDPLREILRGENEFVLGKITRSRVQIEGELPAGNRDHYHGIGLQRRPIENQVHITMRQGRVA